MAITATPRRNKVLSVMLNLLSFFVGKNGNEKDVQQVSDGCCVVLSLLSMHTAINSRASSLHLHCIIQVSSDVAVCRHGGSGSYLVSG